MGDHKELSIPELFRMFPDDETAEKWFRKKRWPNGVTCPRCGCDDINDSPSHSMKFRCRGCTKYFSTKTNSIMHSSNLGYQIWALAIYMIAVKPKGMSSVQLSKELGVSQKTAWHLAHKIREVWKEDSKKMVGETEVDEAYFGGKEKNKHSKKKLRAGPITVPLLEVIELKIIDE